ncbi:MAG: glycosyltransferase family 4 protein [Candidatus Omnitrophica bacterium]|nr:glycosyltransferase family 4 protein [Candidatus Omnitrophota bacterium]
MNICYFLPHIGLGKNGEIIGGSANSAVNLAKKIGFKNHNNIILAVGVSFRQRESFKKVDIKGLQFIPIYMKAQSSGYKYGIEYCFRAIYTIIRLNSKYRFDIIHGHSGFAIYGIVTALLGIIINISTLHTVYCPLKPSFKEKIVVKTAYRFINKVIAMTDNVFNSLLKVGINKQKVEKVSPVIDFSNYCPKESGVEVKKKLLGNDFTGKTLLFVGNLKPNKGMDLLIEVAAKLKNSFQHIRTVITTEMKMPQLANTKTKMFLQKVNEKIKKYQLKDFLVFLETVEDMPQLINASDLVVIPFRNTFGPSDYPLIALEAMACSKPVVAFDIGGMPELIKNGYNGQLVKLGDTEGMARVISGLFSNEGQLEKMGRNGQEFIKTFLSAENTYKKMEKIYEELL